MKTCSCCGKEMVKKYRHRFMCADATEPENFQRLMQGDKAELCFTSPPYADQREYNGDKKLSTEHLATFISIAKDSVTLFAVNLGLARRSGEIVPYWDDYIKEAKACGLKLLSWNVWDRTLAGSVAQATAMFRIDHEFVFIFGVETKKLNLTIPNEMAGLGEGRKSRSVREKDGETSVRVRDAIRSHRQMGTVYRGRMEMHNDTGHPAVFPVHFPESFILACTDEKEIVYEPFLGSGTTLIASEKTKRRCRAFELDPKYCEVILARWKKYTGKDAVLLERNVKVNDE